jgi:hypothetical protein
MSHWSLLEFQNAIYQQLGDDTVGTDSSSHTAHHSTALPRTVTFSEEMWSALTPEIAEHLAEEFGASTLVMLPAVEIRFFEWLKVSAPTIWRDLWELSSQTQYENTYGGTPESAPQSPSQLVLLEDSPVEHEPYLVGMGLLPELVRHGRGFPICDLESEPNFYFSYKSFHAEEIKPFLDAAQARFEAGEELSIEQVFVLEIRRAPIDIWRFAYQYGVPIEQMKSIALKFVADGLFKQTFTREELSDVMNS